MDEAERCSTVGYIFQSNLIALGKVDELGSLPVVNDPNFKHLEVSCDQVMPTFQFLRNQDYVSDVTIFGRSLHIVVPVSIDIEWLRNEMSGKSFGVSEIRPIKPSLEDVFVTLTEHEEAKQALNKATLKQ